MQLSLFIQCCFYCVIPSFTCSESLPSVSSRIRRKTRTCISGSRFLASPLCSRARFTSSGRLAASDLPSITAPRDPQPACSSYRGRSADNSIITFVFFFLPTFSWCEAIKRVEEERKFFSLSLSFSLLFYFTFLYQLPRIGDLCGPFKPNKPLADQQEFLSWSSLMRLFFPPPRQQRLCVHFVPRCLRKFECPDPRAIHKKGRKKRAPHLLLLLPSTILFKGDA